MVVRGGEAVSYERGTPVQPAPEPLPSEEGTPTQGPSWGYLKKSIFKRTLSIFGDECPQNGSKNDPMAPRTTLECPHEGPSVAEKVLRPAPESQGQHLALTVLYVPCSSESG